MMSKKYSPAPVVKISPEMKPSPHTMNATSGTAILLHLSLTTVVTPSTSENAESMPMKKIVTKTTREKMPASGSRLSPVAARPTTNAFLGMPCLKGLKLPYAISTPKPMEREKNTGEMAASHSSPDRSSEKSGRM